LYYSCQIIYAIISVKSGIHLWHLSLL